MFSYYKWQPCSGHETICFRVNLDTARIEYRSYYDLPPSAIDFIVRGLSQIAVSGTPPQGDIVYAVKPPVVLDGSWFSVGMMGPSPLIRFAQMSASIKDIHPRILRVPRTKSQRQGKANRMIANWCSLLPRRSREAFQRDLEDDVEDYREAGWTEEQLVKHVRRQIFIAAMERICAIAKPAAWFAAMRELFRLATQR